MARGTFQTIWLLVSQIPEGRVATYGQIARMVGLPRGARTVGWALHSLPAGSGVPWHRVISAPGRIRRSGQEHEVALQRALLEAEGVEVGTGGTVSLERFGWDGLSGLEVEALLSQIDRDGQV